MHVLEAIEHARVDETAARLLGIVDGGELEVDEDLVRVVGAVWIRVMMNADTRGTLTQPFVEQARDRPGPARRVRQHLGREIAAVEWMPSASESSSLPRSDTRETPPA